MVVASGTDYHQILRDHGVCPSAQRVAIFAWMQEHPEHPTVECIYHALRRQLLKLSLATVYNTIRTFVEHGLVTKVYIEEGELRYDANVIPHAHFKCKCCGAVFDLGDVPEGLAGAVALPPGYQSEDLAVTIWGYCPACRAHEPSAVSVR